MTTIRVLGAGDAAAYQALRLRALRESPTAFSSSYDEEVGRTAADVVTRVTPAPDGSKCVFGGFVGPTLAGTVTVVRALRTKVRHVAEIAGMFVAPEHRRQRVGQALLSTAVAHARSLDAVRQIRLAVTAGNAPARNLYVACGFVRYGVEPRALYVDGRFYDEELYVLRCDGSDDAVEGVSELRG